MGMGMGMGELAAEQEPGSIGTWKYGKRENFQKSKKREGVK